MRRVVFTIPSSIGKTVQLKIELSEEMIETLGIEAGPAIGTISLEEVPAA